MRKTNGRSRPVCGSHVRSAAVETLEICRMPSASASSATARRELARVRPHDGEGAVAGGERGGVAARRRSSCRCGTPRAAAAARGRLPRGSRPRPRGARPAATAGRTPRSGRWWGRRRRWAGLPPRGSRRGRARRGRPSPRPPRRAARRSRSAGSAGADEGQEEDDGRGPLRHRGQRSTPARAAVRRGAAARRAGPGPRGGRATAIQPVPAGAASSTLTSRRPARSSASSAACSASSGWLFFLERWARTTCRHASPRPFSRSRPTSPFERCPSGPRMRSLSDQGYGPSRSIAGS